MNASADDFFYARPTYTQNCGRAYQDLFLPLGKARF